MKPRPFALPAHAAIRMSAALLAFVASTGVAFADTKPGDKETAAPTPLTLPNAPLPTAVPQPPVPQPPVAQPPVAQPPVAPPVYRWIDVDLSSQRLVAYQAGKAVFTTRVSSGVTKYPTVKGTFYIYAKLPTTRMRGGTGADHYDLPNVPHVMYFYKGYGLHGAYWHNNFGRPMSHGCVNLSLAAAKWLFNWASVGTRVVVHQ
jgi:hypothetical protein